VENLELGLTLVDQVAGPAKRAADALHKVEEQGKKAQDALDFSKQLERTEKKLHAIHADPKGASKLFEAQKKLAEVQRKLGKPGWAAAGAEEFGHKLRNAIGAVAIAELMMKGMEKVVDFFKEGVTEAFKAGAAQEKLALSYKLMFGAHGGKEKMEDQERFAKNTPLIGSELARLMIPLYNSGMSDKAARQAVSTAGDLSARTGRPIEEFVEMLTRINLKGGVTDKILVGLGMSVKDFDKQLGKSQHVSAEQAKKMRESGKIDPQTLINQITRKTNADQGGGAGTGWKQQSETLDERWKKIKTLPEE